MIRINLILVIDYYSKIWFLVMFYRWEEFVKLKICDNKSNKFFVNILKVFIFFKFFFFGLFLKGNNYNKNIILKGCFIFWEFYNLDFEFMNFI